MKHRKQNVKKARRAKKEKKFQFFDYSLLFVIILLVCFGLVMLYSTSSYTAQLSTGDSTYYLKRQLFSTSLGLLGMFVLSKIDYHVWMKFSFLAYILANIMCLAVNIPGIGVEINGSRRWLGVGSLTFQPSEFAKVAVIIFLAFVISKMPEKMKKISNVVRVMLFVFPLFAVVAYNNLSTAIIIFGIGVALVFVAAPQIWYFLAGGGAVIGGGVIFLLFFSSSYRGDRFMIWLHPEIYDKGYQTLQGLYAIGSGGLFGKGLGQSMQKLGFLPEAQNDMIFSVICEELGIFGAVCVILLFLVMIWRLMVIANNASDLYGALIASGILAHIAIQVILNIAVVTNSIPNTGITLPFISYGGTSAIFLLSEMGLALNISRGIKMESEGVGV